ncbi:MAG: COX15/CtaA family protein [Chthoniobacteraceae bacterium]
MQEPSPWLSRLAKLVVVAAFWVILVGGHTTTTGAGMAFPDWPLSDGSLNPDGWLTDWMKGLEHSHRLSAGFVASLSIILFVWLRNVRASVPPGTVSLAGWAALAVLAQALLGGLRVVLDPQGIAPTTSGIATTFRVLHGCFAQVFLVLAVVLAARLSPVWLALAPEESAPRIRRLAIIAIGLYFAQLIVGAAMRHPGAGLAIPTWPKVGDAWLPAQWSVFIILNFLHTRVIAVLLAGHVIGLVPRLLRCTRRLSRPGLALVALVAVQVALGVLVIWKAKHPHITTAHVFNGAAILACAVLLAARAGRSSELAKT